MKKNQNDSIKITLLIVAAALLSGCGDDRKEATKETEQTIPESVPTKPAPPVENDAPKTPEQRIEAPESEPEPAGVDKIPEPPEGKAAEPAEALLPPPDTETEIETETSSAVATDQKAASDATEIVKPTPAEVRKIQQGLLDAGFNPGPVDGLIGPKTMTALESFQKQKGLAAGHITKETLQALGITR
ncbi:peptidoglycan-binding protein [Methylobacter sp. BBA5.1]|jgi:putative peptidoglycan binding protein|uniref:peptidoglycan-binding domain-containing protein n=1 Tax=Methylobacter sp. BBA5.1 TaxID=1495064 RepID=UPI000690C385|nr:peptidoglycan-binding domain-containing protein [Methylobacter sp. BBA5.1]